MFSKPSNLFPRVFATSNMVHHPLEGKSQITTAGDSISGPTAEIDGIIDLN
jgi:hypothetical protein